MPETTRLEDGTEIIESSMSNSSALEALNRSEIDIQIATAHRFPRNIKKCVDEAMSMATRTPETAERMLYSLPRGGKRIEGPSVRLAEIVGSSWGNLRYGARVVSVDDKFVTAQGACHDLEKNVAANVDVRRRITDKNGKRYNDDMIVVTSNAACSIALRQAIFKVVPFSLVEQVFEAAKAVAIGDASSLADRRQKAVDYFVSKVGIPLDRVLAVLNRLSVEQITLDDLGVLTGLKSAIKEGDTSVDEAFPALADDADKPGVAERLAAAKKKAADAKGNKVPTDKPGEQADTKTGEVTTQADASSQMSDAVDGKGDGAGQEKKEQGGAPSPEEQQRIEITAILMEYSGADEAVCLKKLNDMCPKIFKKTAFGKLDAKQVGDIKKMIEADDVLPKKS